jgi:hypothetical protein
MLGAELLWRWSKTTERKNGVRSLRDRHRIGEQPNEDFVAASPSVAVVLDGLSAPQALSTGCAHGTPWFVARLGSELLSSAITDPGQPLQEVLAGAITRVANLHVHTCDLEDPGTPAASVTIVRERDQDLDYLVLFDSVIVLDGPSDLKVVTDRRVDAFAQAEESAIREHPIGSPEHQARVDELVAAQRRHRNQPGGYWVAGAKPAAAYEAVAGSLPRSLITRVALLSDGVSCLVDRYGAGDWSWLLTVLQVHGPRRLIARARELESSDPAGLAGPGTRPATTPRPPSASPGSRASGGDRASDLEAKLDGGRARGHDGARPQAIPPHRLHFEAGPSQAYELHPALIR